MTLFLYFSIADNSNNDGPYVHTGFKPAWIMLKNTGASANWRMHDIIRQPHNTGGGHLLQSNQASAEVTSEYDMDFLSNGFKIRSSDSYENGSGNTFLYLAFAKAPSKYSNANFGILAFARLRKSSTDGYL